MLASQPQTASFFQAWGRDYLIEIAVLTVTWLVAAWMRNQVFAWIVIAACIAFNELQSGKAKWRAWRDRRVSGVRLRDLQHDLEKMPVARVQRVESDKVIQVLGDEVALYLYDLEDGRFFLAYLGALSGQREPEDWPNSCFELVKIQGWNEFGPICYGRKIEPIEFLDAREIDWEKLPAEACVYEGSLDSLRVRGQ